MGGCPRGAGARPTAGDRDGLTAGARLCSRGDARVARVARVAERRPRGPRHTRPCRVNANQGAAAFGSAAVIASFPRGLRVLRHSAAIDQDGDRR